MRLSISLNLSCKLVISDGQEMVAELPLVWIEKPLSKWNKWYKRTRQTVERLSTALTVASIGLSAARYGAGI